MQKTADFLIIIDLSPKTKFFRESGNAAFQRTLFQLQMFLNKGCEKEQTVHPLYFRKIIWNYLSVAFCINLSAVEFLAVYCKHF